ncbi:MAG: FAD-dependent monooxygenase, partial [Betaproteobacteria bacterium]
VTPIDTIDISQKGGFGVTRLTAREAGVPALGYVVRYGELQGALDAALAAAGIAVEFERKVDSILTTPDAASVLVRGAAGQRGDTECATRLVVVADGSGELLPALPRRKVDYQQSALTGVVTASAPRTGTAFERFTTDGPAALLPFESGYALIWTATPQHAADLLALDDASFLAALQQHFGERVGRFMSVARRKAFPLLLQFATQVVGERAVLLGNAAQSLHPIAGQGFNLGLRDVWTLAQQLLDTPRTDVGSAQQLRRYAQSRRTDRWAGMAVTHGLVSAFASNHPLLAVPRGLGLTLIDSIPPLKRAFARGMLNGLR